MCLPTAVTGVAKGTNLGGLLFDPLNLSGKFGPKPPGPPEQADPANERAVAEAEAVQRANAQLAMDQRRRRQQSLLSKGASGAPAPDFGSEGTDDAGASPLGGARLTSRTSVARNAASLMSRGAPVVYGGGGFSGGGGRNGGRTQLV